MALHVSFTRLAFRVFPVVALLLTLASLFSNAFPRRVTVAWGVLTAVLIGYVVTLGWGPDVSTPQGLMLQVAAQKIVTMIAVGTFIYLSVEADRVVSSGTRLTS